MSEAENPLGARKAEKPAARDDFEFQRWVEFEKIAMHFNDLLIKLRVQALGGVAAIGAVVGLITRPEAHESPNWGILAAVSLLLLLVWWAIW